MRHRLSLAYSPCPNDTFMFYALAHGKVCVPDVELTISLADVETLNLSAATGKYDITKLSFAALAHLQDTYALLKSGSALGRGCGPLIVAKPGFKLDQLTRCRIAVPGLWTTACMLLRLYLPGALNLVVMPFDQIMPSVAKDEVDTGVIIHEGRFTYPNYGLEKYLDLGQWWEDTTSLPIPLGGIAIRKDVASSIKGKITSAIRNSIDYAMTHRDEAMEYMKTHAQEMADSVIWQHVDLYVNHFSRDLGPEGEQAVERLFQMAKESKMLQALETQETNQQ